MKRALLFLGTFLMILSSGCIGPEGPPGRDGFDGRDGQDGADAELSKVVDIQGTFSADNDYSLFYEFPNNLEVFETDVVLVYLLWDQTEDGNGDPVDIWRLLPQTRILDQGLLQYNYDHTFFDVNIFLEADFDMATLLSGDTDDQVFRIAVIPAESLGGKMDRSNIASVMAQLGITEKDIPRIKLN
ncbi:MAG: collagen-like protein [Flavobacteriaceae bacterium]